MASIKVTYGQTSRKFTIASNTTWTEFESHLHDLFNIPNETKISLSYVDEDNDIITLSTDSELQQILSDQESFGTDVKFNLYTSENPDNNDGWVLENAEEKEGSVTTLSDDESTSSKDEVVAYNISEPSETENQTINVQTEERQPAVETDYPHVTITDEKDDPLFEPTAPTEKNSEKQQEELLVPVDSEKEQDQESDPLNNNEESSSDEKAKENTEKDSNNTENDSNDSSDSNIIFIISSSPWIQRTYYRPKVSSFAGLLSGYPTHFGHFIQPRYSYITPSYTHCYRRRPYFGCESTYSNRFGLL